MLTFPIAQTKFRPNPPFWAHFAVSAFQITPDLKKLDSQEFVMVKIMRIQYTTSTIMTKLQIHLKIFSSLCK